MTVKTLEATASLGFQPGSVRLCGAATIRLTKSSLNKTISLASSPTFTVQIHLKFLEIFGTNIGPKTQRQKHFVY